MQNKVGWNAGEGCPIGFEVELRRRFEPCRGLDSRGQNCSASSFGTKECGTKELFRTQSITETFWVLAVALTKFEFAWLLFCCFEAFLHLYNFIFFTFQYIISKPPYLLRNTTYNMVGNLGKDKPKGPQQKCNCQICNEPNCSLTVLQNHQKGLMACWMAERLKASTQNSQTVRLRVRVRCSARADT